MNEKLEQLHAAVSALADTVLQVRQENAALKSTVAQLSEQCHQLRQQHEEEAAQFWLRHNEAQQTLTQTAQQLRAVLATLAASTDKDGAS